MAGGLGIDGLVSGLDTTSIINSLLAARQRPIQAIETKIDKVEDRKRALLDINSRLLGLQEVAQRLRFPSQFNRAAVRSSNESVLLATGSTSSLTGSFSFVGKQLAAGSQFVSGGFKDADTTGVSTAGGNITIEVGDALLSRETDLSTIRGGHGFDRGSIRITDDNGNTAVIDLSQAVTLQEVVDLVNNNGKAAVTARINDTAASSVFGDALVIANASGSGSITVADVGLDQTATSLGIAGTSGTGTLNGTSINALDSTTQLALLNDSRGLNGGQAPATITINGSINIAVNLAGVVTLGDVISKINTAGGGTITAALTTDGKGLRLTDTGAPAALTVTSSAGTTTAEDLGLTADVLANAGGGVFNGRALVARFGSVLSQSLKGVSAGGGLSGSVGTPSTFTVVDSLGGSTTVSITGREDLAHILAQVNQPTIGTANVTARINAAGNGIELVDDAGGPGGLTITDVTGTAAARLGISGAHSDGNVDGGNANLWHFHAQKSLTALNAGRGVVDGDIRVKLRNGNEASIDTTAARTVGDMVARLDAVTGLDARINDTGDGILLTDTTGGTGELVVEDLEGTVAKSLNLAGTYTTASVDRRFEFSVAVAAGDTLNEIMLSVLDATDLVSVNTFGDGSAVNPARLSIAGKGSGANAAVLVTSTVAELSFGQTSRARDAVMLFGASSGSAEPQVLRSRNSRFDVLAGVALDLVGTSSQPVTVGIERDVNAVANDITELVDAFNALAERIDEHTAFDAETLTTAPLHGDAIVLNVENAIRRMLLDPVNGLSSATNNVTAIGIGIDSNGRVTLDSEILLEALQNRFDQVVELFSHSAELSATTALDKLNNGQGINTGDGNDVRVNFRDGTYLDLDLDGGVDLSDLMAKFNADARVTLRIGDNNRRLELVDNTAGTNTFSIQDLNTSGVLASLGLNNITDTDADGELVGANLIVADQLGVGRRMDLNLERYVDPLEGVFKELTDNADSQVERFNDDIERMNKLVEMERARLEAQFAALEKFLAESQSIQSQLASQLQVISGNNNQ
ncbi:MAG: flagellar filament capping protein FliD [Planctomycetes bacterium]|nr:flagellar filament capping protein FliD [Planctomycetota bacterium]